MHTTLKTFGVLISALLTSALPAQEHKELGRMWTFENAPLGWFQQAYDFNPDQEWLDHARLSSLRFGRGCSASFVSAHGLIMTNHHCARGNVAQVQGDNDWLKDGYYAGGYEGEVQLPGLTVQQLVGTRDVTAAVRDGADRDQLLAAAKEAAPELTHQFVSLYQGGMSQIYSYRIWDDIRLVCAPHGQSAHFGGDPDNFCYPRWGLDFTFVRAYEDGRPADTVGHHFRWKTEGAEEGELVFVTGNPGNTGRLQTVAQCEYLRDHHYPEQVERVRSTLDRLVEQAAESPAREKELRTRILGMENSRKANQGYLDGLRNERVMAIKRQAEADLRAAVAAVPELQEKYGDAWDILADLQQQKIAARGNRDAMREIGGKEREQQTRIGEACFAVYGTSIPPDATFTLRISDGIVKGYPMNGTIAPAFTSLYGLYGRHTEFGGAHPFDLPKIWLDREKKLDLHTPFNFVATCDIIGGNSGSPMIDREQRIVGLIFDGNIEMLGNNYVFDDEVSRTVSVHPAIIIEALRKIYDADALADELEKGKVRRFRKAGEAPAAAVGR
jgi:hypothetical protein